MATLDFNRPLSPDTVSAILAYLEKRPLGEVYSLFQSIVAQLMQETADNERTLNGGSGAAATGGGDTDQRADSVLPMEIK